MKESDIHIIFESVAGSRLYGTSRPDSDYDYRGVGIPHFITVFGTHNFEQLEQKAPDDRVIYSLAKFFQLALKANPNILEMLFVPREHWIKATPIWEKVVENRRLFVSKKVRYTFLGYAYSQLNRIKVHKKWIDNPPTKPDRKEMGLSLESKIRPDILEALRTIPATVLGDELSQAVRAEVEYQTAKKAWDDYHRWVEQRNPARAELESKYGYDTKHAMHLIRLVRMGKEILETGELHVDRRDIDAQELLSIRNGAMTYDEVISYAEQIEEEIKELYATNLSIPHSPPIMQIDMLLEDILCEFYGIDKQRAMDAVKLANGD